MKKLKDLKIDEHFETYLLIKTAELRRTKAGKDYLAFTFQDETGQIDGKLWDAQPIFVERFKAGVVVNIKGKKELYNGMPQLNQITLQLANNINLRPEDFKEKPPVNVEKLREEMTQTIFDIKNPTWNRIVRHLLKKYDEEFFSYPAAKTNHHAFETGLAFHSLTMIKIARNLSAIYPELNASLLYSGIILHDLAKVIELSGVNNTEYTLRGNLIGHIVLIDEEISKAIIELNIDENREDVLILRHVILSHHGLLEYGSPVRPKIMEAEIIHQIDNLDATMQMLSGALRQVSPGETTSRVFALDNRNFYKPTFKDDISD
ncbi:MAG: HD domain-containing protein [Streptococcaceae bacterium]|jgi:3'-5' exoribonuclease|nr:HD domain-containing protein [Streptococcaceae bacterium]MCH4176168.1 HD domain-containing protein [Streptococcaceae bacterium]